MSLQKGIQQSIQACKSNSKTRLRVDKTRKQDAAAWTVSLHAFAFVDNMKGQTILPER